MSGCPGRVDVVIETLILLLAGVLGVSVGTLSTYLYMRQRLEALGSRVDMLVSLVEERGVRLKRLEDSYKGLEDRLSVLEDLAVHRSAPANPRIDVESSSTGSSGGEEDEILNLKILALHKNGYSIRQIAREVGLSKSTVHKRLKRLLEATKA